jgi:hypothetical protein
MDQLDLTNGQAAASSAACGFHTGQMSSPCTRCKQPYVAHWPELNRGKRERRTIQAVCDVCSYPVESDQHTKHCRG